MRCYNAAMRIIISILAVIAGLVAMAAGRWVVFYTTYGQSPSGLLNAVVTVIGYAMIVAGAVSALVGSVRLFRR